MASFTPTRVGPNFSTSSAPAMQSTSSDDHNHQKVNMKKEVFKFKSDWLISSLAWSNEPGEALQLAISSYVEKYRNHVQIVQLDRDEYDQNIRVVSEIDHPYPATKILWSPGKLNFRDNQFLATTADYLRIWRTSPSSGTKLECLLNSNSQGSKLCAPLTSFDWNDVDSRMIVTSSVDTTCTVWDIEAKSALSQTLDGRVQTQILAHDHQVYDVAFSKYGSGRNVFVSCGGDGTLKLFDLRRMDGSNVLYEESNEFLVRVSCSKQNPNLVATFALDSSEIIILDIRKPKQQVDVILKNHCDNLNGISWAPHLAHHVCSAADDGQALIWDISKRASPFGQMAIEPLLTYRANGKINFISWSSEHPDWIAISYRNYLELLRV